MLTLQASAASKVAGGLLALSGLLGVVLLATDQILREALSGRHFYGLIVLVIIDFAAAAYVLTKPSKSAFTLAAAWGALRIVISIADVFVGPATGVPVSSAEFADYLFNPTLTSPPNPPGVPGVLMDLITVLEVIVIGIAWSARSSAQKK